MEFNHYFTNEELAITLEEWVKRYPELLRLDTIGKSHAGKPIWLLALTNFATGTDLEKPAVWLDGNIHATELAGTTTVLYCIDHMLSAYGNDEKITHLLDTSAIYAVPRINPDGAEAALDANPRFLRSGIRPYPWKEAEDGLHMQDIDGDSRIIQMRIADPNGDWKPWDEDPRFLVKRQPEDFGGSYYRLLPEGLVENYDGYCIRLAPPAAGLDFNRNFPFDWRPENEQTGAGPFPASEPEINAVVRFITEHHNINVGLSFHTFSRALLRPFSTMPDDQMNQNDLQVYKILGEIGTRLTGYRNVSTFHDFLSSPKDVTTGAFDDWLYDHQGAFVFTVELWDLPSEAGIKDRKFFDWFVKHPPDDDIMIFNWIKEHGDADSYVSWYPFTHPQLGPVELGGWNTLYTWRNPPKDLMEREAARHLPFVTTLANLMPHLDIHTLKSVPAGPKTWLIDLVIENSGYLPTFTSQQAKKRGAVRPVLAELYIPENGRILLGKQLMEVGHLEGRSNKEDMASVFGSSPTDNRAHVQWLVEGSPGDILEIYIRSERAGVANGKVTLTE